MGRLNMNRGILFLGLLLIGHSFIGDTATAQIVDIYYDRQLWTPPALEVHVEDFNDPILNPDIDIISEGWEVGVAGGQWRDYVCEEEEPPIYKDVKIIFDNEVYGFGGYWDLSPGGPGTGIRIEAYQGINDIFYVDDISSNYEGQFWGVRFSIPVKEIYLYEGGEVGSSETFFLDDLVYYDSWETPSVPIPTSVWLLGSGIVGIAGLRRKIFR